MKGGKEGHLRGGGLRGWKEGDIKGKADRGGGAETGEYSRARRRGTRACNCGPLWRNVARAAHGETGGGCVVQNKSFKKRKRLKIIPERP